MGIGFSQGALSFMNLGIGIIGFCGHAYLAMQGWELLRSQGIELELIGVATDSDSSIPSEALSSLSKNYKTFASWEDLINDPAVDVVVVDGPYYLHAAMSSAALLAGKHVFAEKLVALDWSQYDLLLRAYEETREQSLHFWSMMALRYAAPFYTAISALKSNVIGSLRQVHMQKSYKNGTRPDWYGDREKYGGTIPWVGSHALDLIYVVAGQAQSTSAVQTQCPEGYERSAFIQSRHAAGVLSSASLDFYRPATASTHADDRLRLVGDAGVIEARGGEVFIINDDGERLLELIDPRDDVFAAGLRFIVGQISCDFSAQEVFDVARFCLRARDSADAGGQLKTVQELI